ncbi:MAG: methionine ABC transporter ATP-binding protein [Bacillota bacterium]
MITLNHIHKQFTTKDTSINALEDVSLTIEPNVIHGIIGLSGAGKSTLIRLINQLETQDLGTVSVFGYQDIKALNKESTRMLRAQIGMIFQHFNLLESKTVKDNILFPLRATKTLTKKDHDHALALIDDVGLSGYESHYPSQLSGGQKQRVGIARALINNPKVLLCDEPTSALDPLTTKSILALLKTIQTKRELTVIIVTHDMHVIKEICDVVTVMHHGQIIEAGSVDQVLFQPTHDVTKELVHLVGFNLDDIMRDFAHLPHLTILKFSKTLTSQTILSHISQTHHVLFNILFANIAPNKEGLMLVSIDTDDIYAVKKTLKDQGVVILHD